MATNLPPPPQYHLTKVFCRVPMKAKLSDLKETAGQGVLATSEAGGYPTVMPSAPTSEAFRGNFARLLHSLMGTIPPEFYPLIHGKIPQSQVAGAVAKIKRTESDTMSLSVGASSWLYEFVRGEISWMTFQTLLDNWDKEVRRLAFRRENESEQDRTSRHTLRREYKKALRIHMTHIRNGVLTEITEAQIDLQRAVEQSKPEAEIRHAREKLAMFEQHRSSGCHLGLTPEGQGVLR